MEGDTMTAAPDRAYALRAEIRAIEEGHKCWADTHGPDTYEVVSHEQPDVRYRLRTTHHFPGSVIRVSCTCPSGVHRAEVPIPCKHAALVARRLERAGEAEWRDGWWWDTRTEDYDETIDGHPDDPFEGLTGGDL